MEEYEYEAYFTLKQWVLLLPVFIINLAIFVSILLLLEDVRVPFMWMVSAPLVAFFTIEGGTRWIDFLDRKGIWE
tara:strand:+ start:534 stop:758 length:225 start_codon:yes stop_codon:yes gene_type:complete